MKVNEVQYNSPTVDWMPEIPSHWKVVRIKNLFYEVDERSKTGREDLLSVSHYTGVTLRKEGFDDDVEITNARTLVGYKIVDVGDLVINIMLAWNGSLGVSRFKGITSPAYCVFKLKENYNPEYFGYLFSTALFKGEFKKSSTGIIDSRLRLYSDDFFRIFSLVPPKDEQDKIVKYIKENSAKIQHFIETKQRFIELLKEQRQNIITSVVTKGIDKNVKLKSSGVAWLGDIPEHWEVRSIKNILIKEKGAIKAGPFGSDLKGTDLIPQGIKVYNQRTVLDNNFNLGEEFISNAKFQELRVFEVKTNDVLLTTRGSIGKAAIVPTIFEKGIIHPCLIRLRFDFNLVDTEFITLVLNDAKYFEDLVKMESNSNTIDVIYADTLKFMKLLIPPKIEQKEIIKFIKRETLSVDIAISKAEREIGFMEEYRGAIIYEAVTGKII